MFEYFIEEVGIVFTGRGAAKECPNFSFTQIVSVFGERISVKEH